MGFVSGDRARTIAEAGRQAVAPTVREQRETCCGVGRTLGRSVEGECRALGDRTSTLATDSGEVGTSRMQRSGS